MIKRVHTNSKIPVKFWLDDIEEGAAKQAEYLANLPFAFHHVAIMPDAHIGYAMPIGGVLATVGAIMPFAIGLDIGCGMCAVETSLTERDQDRLKKVLGHIRELVPIGFNHHKDRQKWDGFDKAPDVEIVQQELQSSQFQLGTLGGGNHFIEIQQAQNGKVWLMLHSGSRNFGLKIANRYHEIAKDLCQKWYSDIPSFDLAFLPIGTEEAQNYIRAMDFALQFAAESRSRMMTAMQTSVDAVFPGTQFSNAINVHHNYARMENHFGKNVIVHRKGATSAQAGEAGIIPGSQGTASYIVRGLGNPESFASCSHGAGRKMGRKQACERLNLEEEIKKLDDLGVVHGMRVQGDLDEAAGAYKDIDTVMANQSDLVEIVTTLKPLAVIKA